ncbi:MAG: S8 family serine peptidase [Bacillota bacterium]
MGRRVILAIVIVLGIVAFAYKSGAINFPDASSEFILLVKYKVPPTVRCTDDPAANALRSIGIWRVNIPRGEDPTRVFNHLNNDPNVEYVEFEQQRKYTGIIPNDPGFDSQLNLELINLPQAWEIERGRETVTVALLDTGVDLNHPDLKGRLVQGWDYINQDDEPFDDSVNSHGTGLAGIIAAEVNNKTGISGITWGIKIMPMKVLDANGQGIDSNIAAAIINAADRGAQIINISFGGGKSSRTVQEAVVYALQRGVSIIAAAGNDGGPVEYPAAYDGVITVGAVDIDKQVASFSNRGPEMDLAAPGVGVISIKQKSAELMAYHGTSVSAAVVTGVVALIASLQPGITPAELVKVLHQTAEDINLPGYDQATGYGLVNAWASLSKVYGGKGEITGSVRFNNINLPGVAVVLEGTGLTTKTDLDGRFQFSGLPPGTYAVSASLNGYPAEKRKVTVGRNGGKFLLDSFTFAQQNQAQGSDGEPPPVLLTPNIIGYKAPLEFRFDRSALRSFDGEKPLTGVLFPGRAHPRDSQWLRNPVIINGQSLQKPLEYLRSRGEYIFRAEESIPDGEYYIVVIEIGKEVKTEDILGWGRFEISRTSTSPALVTAESLQNARYSSLILTNGESQLDLKNAIPELLPGQVAAISFDLLSPEAVKPLFNRLEANYIRAGQTRIVAGVLANNDGKAEPLSLESPVVLSLPVDDRNMTIKGTPGIYWWNGNNWSYVNSQYDPNRKTVKGSTAKTGVFTVMAYTPGFTDVIGGYAKNEIEVLASRQIIKGITPTLFAPEKTITRGQLAALLARALDLNIEKADTLNRARFIDVSTSYWGYKEIEAVSAAGLVNGYTDGSFQPNQPVSREQLAVMLVRALDYLDAHNPEDGSVLDRFSDGKKVSPALAGQVGTAVKLGIIRGSGTGFLLPGSTATRAEAAVMLYRMLVIGRLFQEK